MASGPALSPWRGVLPSGSFTRRRSAGIHVVREITPVQHRGLFTGTHDVVSSPDFDEDYLSIGAPPYVRLCQKGDKVVGDYQVGLQTGDLDGRLEGADQLLFSFEGTDELDPVTAPEY